jgi:hypothetical protein
MRKGYISAAAFRGALVAGRANRVRFPCPFDLMGDGKRKRSRLGPERWEFHARLASWGTEGSREEEGGTLPAGATRLKPSLRPHGPHRQEPTGIPRVELVTQHCAQAIDAEMTEVVVEVLARASA